MNKNYLGDPPVMIDTYLNKSLAEFTVDDRRAARRFAQGVAHAKQGRKDLLGICKHYDAGFSS